MPRRYQGEDLQHIANLLEGVPDQVATKPSTSRRKRSRKQRVVDNLEVDCDARLSSKWNSSQNATLRDDHSTAKPGPRSNKRAWHCEVCDCWISNTRRDGDNSSWTTHVDGITHRRQALSIKMHGEPGHMVVSQFEDSTGAHREKGRVQEPRLADEHVDSDEALLTKLQQRITLELLDHAGGDEYRRIAHRFRYERLEDAWNLLTKERLPRRFHGQFSTNYGKNHGKKLHLECNHVMLVILALAVEQGKVSVEELAIELSMDETNLAVMQTALTLFMESLCETKTLRALSFRLPARCMWTDREKMVQAITRALERECKHCLSLRHMQIIHDGCDMRSLRWEEDFEQVSKTLMDTRNKAKAVLLLGAKSQSSSMLASLCNLPNDLLGLIFDKAFPRYLDIQLIVDKAGMQCAGLQYDSDASGYES